MVITWWKVKEFYDQTSTEIDSFGWKNFLGTLLLLIFADLIFAIFATFKKIAKLKTREKLFQTFSIVFFMLIAYFLAKSRKLSPAKYARSIFAKLSSRENK